MTYFQGEFEERCHSTGSPNHLSFFTATWSIIFLLLNIPGNLLVILAVTLDPYKNLRTPFNYLMASLACADLLVGTVTEPISVYIHFKEGLDLNLSLEELETLHLSYFISCTASVLSLGTLAVERYLAIRNPHTYRNKLTGKRILGTIAAIWVISLLLPQLYFEVGFITYAFIFANTALVAVFVITCFIYGLILKKFYNRRTQYDKKEEVRCETMMRKNLQARYESVVKDSQVSQPHIGDQSKVQDCPDNSSQMRDQIQLHDSQSGTRENEIQNSPGTQHENEDQNIGMVQDGAISAIHDESIEPVSTTQSTYRDQDQLPGNQSTITPSPSSNAIYNSCQAMEQKVTKMFLVVLIAMLCCYGPSTVFIYVMSFCETCKCNSLHWFRDLQFLFVIMNSSVNFYCYAIRSPRFLKAFKHILRRKRYEAVSAATLKSVKKTHLNSSS